MSNHVGAKAMRTMSIQREKARIRKQERALSRVQALELDRAEKQAREKDKTFWLFGFCVIWIFALLAVLHIAMSQMGGMYAP